MHKTRLRATGCEGTHLIIRDGRIITKTINPLPLRGPYVIGASSVRSVKGLDGELVFKVSVRSPERALWEGERCVIGKKACSLSKYKDVLYLDPGEYVVDVDLVDTPSSLNAELCIGPAPVHGGLLVSGARPSGHVRMRPAQGSTRSRSLMVSDPASIGGACVQRIWLWFFEPRPSRAGVLVVRLETIEGLVNSIQTELLRTGMYSEVVIDVLTPRWGDKVLFLEPANLTRPLFIIHTEGCSDAG